MAGFEPTYEGIQEMILRYQYFLTCDKSLQIFLKEKGKLSLKEMTKVSNDYFEAGSARYSSAPSITTV